MRAHTMASLTIFTLALLSYTCGKYDETPNDNLPGIDGYPIVSTGQVVAYDTLNSIPLPGSGSPFFGQDANYLSEGPHYTDNGDGTVTDEITGLMWQQDPGAKMSYSEAVSGAGIFNLGGYSDWRLPSIKELYSLILFSGVDPSGHQGTSTDALTPFIDTSLFRFKYGDASVGERIIDAQYISSTPYAGNSTFGGGNLVFGVNFADGRIKGYPGGPPPGQTQDMQFFVMYVRGNDEYGDNDFRDNGDGTVSDMATGLMWMKADAGDLKDWPDALVYADTLSFAGYDDWRLPDVKELQSIVDYSRSPDSDNSAAIDPVFLCTPDTNEAGQHDYSCYWSSTTHVNLQNGSSAAYVSFGRAMGFFQNQWMDVHGAGAQRSDPKVGDPSDWPTGHGPQGDAIRILNSVRLVRN